MYLYTCRVISIKYFFSLMLIHLTTAAADLSTDKNVILLNVSLVATLANVTVPFKSLQSQKKCCRQYTNQKLDFRIWREKFHSYPTINFYFREVNLWASVEDLYFQWGPWCQPYVFCSVFSSWLKSSLFYTKKPLNNKHHWQGCEIL